MKEVPTHSVRGPSVKLQSGLQNLLRSTFYSTPALVVNEPERDWSESVGSRRASVPPTEPVLHKITRLSLNQEDPPSERQLRHRLPWHGWSWDWEEIGRAWALFEVDEAEVVESSQTGDNGAFPHLVGGWGVEDFPLTLESGLLANSDMMLLHVRNLPLLTTNSWILYAPFSRNLISWEWFWRLCGEKARRDVGKFGRGLWRQRTLQILPNRSLCEELDLKERLPFTFLKEHWS